MRRFFTTHLNASMRFFILSPPNTRNRASSKDRKNLRKRREEVNGAIVTHLLAVKCAEKRGTRSDALHFGAVILHLKMPEGEH